MTRNGESVENQRPVTRAFSGYRVRRGAVLAGLRTVGVVALVFVLVMSPMAPAIATASAAGPSGFVTLPDAAVNSDIPTHAQDQLPNVSAFRGSVMATTGADTLEVTITTETRAMGRTVDCSPDSSNGSLDGTSTSTDQPEPCTDPAFAMVLSDDTEHSGRYVAVNASALEDALGHVPKMAYGLHEDGSQWTSPIRRNGRMAVFYVPKFSTNTVSFSGEVKITDEPASDGTQHVYNLSDLDAASDPNVTFTGAIASAWDNQSSPDVSNGGSVAIDVAGNLEPTGPSANGEPVVSFTGTESTFAESRSGTNVDGATSSSISVGGDEAPKNAKITFNGDTTTNPREISKAASPSGSVSVSIGGNLDPTGPSANNKPELTITNNDTKAEINPVSNRGDGATDSSLKMVGDDPNDKVRGFEIEVKPSTTGPLSDLKVDIAGAVGSDYGPTVDVYLIAESPDGVAGESGATKIGTWDPSWGAGWQAISLSSNPELQKGTVYTIEFQTSGTDSDATEDALKLATDGSPSTDHVGYEVGNSGGTLSYYGSMNVTIKPTAKSVEVSDGQGTTVSFGDIGLGQSVTKEFNVSHKATSLNLTGTGSASLNVTLDFDERTATEDPNVDVDGDGTADASYSGMLKDGQTATKNVSGLSTGSNTLDWGATAGQFDWTLEYDRVEYSEDPSVDIDGDGTADASVSGTISPGSTVTRELASLNTTTDTATVSLSNSTTVNVAFKLKERTETVSPAVEVNGNWLNVTGKLSAGSTVNRTGNSSWLAEGKNRVNVSVGDGSLSADSPSPVVDIVYSHDAQDDKSVSYQAEAFSERYNVSKKYASDRTSATLTIPHQGTVVSMRSVEYRINESGGWSSVASSNYVLDGTELTVDLDAVYGGTIPAGTTIEIRSTGSKVNPYNASITVLDATKVGKELDTKIRLDSWNSDSYLGVSNDAHGDLVHYLANATWSGEDAYAKFDAQDRQRIFMPNANAGGEARMRTIPVKVTAKTGEVLIDVDDPRSTEPKFSVEPGASTGDTVKFTYVSAKDDTHYILYSQTHDVVRDDGTANSPLTLEDDDSSELLQFLVDEDSTSSSSSGSGSSLGGAVGGAMGSSSGSTIVALIAAGALAAVWWLSKEYGDGQVSTTMLFVGEAILLGTIALEAFSPASIVGGIADALAAVGGGIGQGLAKAMPLVIIAAAVLLYRYFKSQDTDIVIQGKKK